MKITMVDLHGQYERIRKEINNAIQEVLDTTAFINGPQVKTFAQHLAMYNQVEHVVPCANGTDALQIALMALGHGNRSFVCLCYFCSGNLRGLCVKQVNLICISVGESNRHFYLFGIFRQCYIGNICRYTVRSNGTESVSVARNPVLQYIV